jgi:ABC-2 type transport system ATP-binding protein
MDLWEAVRGLVADGTDVLMTTQYLDEADKLADRIVIVDHGRVIADGSPATLKAKAGGDVIEVQVRDRHDVPGAAAALHRLGGEPRTDPGALLVSTPVGAGPQRLMRAVRELSDLGVDVDDISLRRPTLDEVFLTLTGARA